MPQPARAPRGRFERVYRVCVQGGGPMRRIFLTSAALFACAAVDMAGAADLPPAAPPPAVAPVVAPPPLWSWSGCYVGVNGGGTRAQNRADLSPAGLYLTPPGNAPPPNINGTGDFAS